MEAAVYFQAGVVFGEGVFADCESQSGAAAVARAAGIDAVEAFGEVREVFGGDAGAAVFDGEGGLLCVVVVGQADADVAACRGVAHGVADEVAECAVQVAVIAVDPEAGGDVGVDVVAVLREVARFAGDGFDEAAEV